MGWGARRGKIPGPVWTWGQGGEPDHGSRLPATRPSPLSSLPQNCVLLKLVQSMEADFSPDGREKPQGETKTQHRFSLFSLGRRVGAPDPVSSQEVRDLPKNVLKRKDPK